METQGKRILRDAYACFGCRKSWKKPAPYLWREFSARPTCPECQGALKLMGRGFAAPRQSDAKGWRELLESTRQKYLAQVGALDASEILRRETVSGEPKARAKEERRVARAKWLKQKKRVRYLKDLELWTQRGA